MHFLRRSVALLCLLGAATAVLAQSETLSQSEDGFPQPTDVSTASEPDATASEPGATATGSAAAPFPTGALPIGTVPTGNTTVTLPNCGRQAAGALCANPTHCCSSYGYCGAGLDSAGMDYCASGCQNGPCRTAANATLSSMVSASTVSPSMTSSPTMSGSSVRPTSANSASSMQSRATSAATSTPASSSVADRVTFVPAALMAAIIVAVVRM